MSFDLEKELLPSAGSLFDTNINARLSRQASRQREPAAIFSLLPSLTGSPGGRTDDVIVARQLPSFAIQRRRRNLEQQHLRAS